MEALPVILSEGSRWRVSGLLTYDDRRRILRGVKSMDYRMPNEFAAGKGEMALLFKKS